MVHIGCELWGVAQHFLASGEAQQIQIAQDVVGTVAQDDVVGSEPPLPHPVAPVPVGQSLLQGAAVGIVFDLGKVAAVGLRPLLKGVEALENAVAQQIGVDPQGAIQLDIPLRQAACIVL